MAELSPLFVLLTVMRQRWASGDHEGAVSLARLAAPYMHGRAPPVRPAGALSGVPDEELDGWGGDAGGFGGEAAAAEAPE